MENYNIQHDEMINCTNNGQAILVRQEKYGEYTIQYIFRHQENSFLLSCWKEKDGNWTPYEIESPLRLSFQETFKINEFSIVCMKNKLHPNVRIN